MTEANFLALKPREQDALVAEHVLGQPFTKPSGRHHGGCCYCTDCWQLHDDCLCGITTTWEGMGKVVEKMKGDRWDVCIMNGPLLGTDPEWAAGFETSDPEAWKRTSEADTPMLAVAIAALKAKGVME